METATLSVSQFCEAHQISKPTFYKIVKEGHGPAILRIRKRMFVTTEAAADWRRRTERQVHKSEHEREDCVASITRLADAVRAGRLDPALVIEHLEPLQAA